MSESPIIISLPIDDRQRSFAFYREALGLEAIGELADDGVPEPLQFRLTADTHLMLIPRGGFGWVIGDRQAAENGASECLLNLAADAAADVDARFARAFRAGATTVTPPGEQPWGYVATFADPDGHLWMITSRTS